MNKCEIVTLSKIHTHVLPYAMDSFELVLMFLLQDKGESSKGTDVELHCRYTKEPLTKTSRYKATHTVSCPT